MQLAASRKSRNKWGACRMCALRLEIVKNVSSVLPVFLRRKRKRKGWTLAGFFFFYFLVGISGTWGSTDAHNQVTFDWTPFDDNCLRTGHNIRNKSATVGIWSIDTTTTTKFQRIAHFDLALITRWPRLWMQKICDTIKTCNLQLFWCTVRTY